MTKWTPRGLLGGWVGLSQVLCLHLGSGHTGGVTLKPHHVTHYDTCTFLNISIYRKFSKNSSGGPLRNSGPSGLLSPRVSPRDQEGRAFVLFVDVFPALGNGAWYIVGSQELFVDWMTVWSEACV